MKLKKLYELIVEKGMEFDPRGKNAVKKELLEAKKQYEKMEAEQKEEFDLECLENPYSDSRILFGRGEEEIKSLMVGIDVDAGEIILADRLKERGKKIDLIISHHPSGRALAALHQVMRMQADIVSLRGVPINIAEGLMQERISEVERKILPVNHAKTVDAAKLLGIPFMCVHTPADNAVNTYLQKMLDAEKPDTLGKIVELLNEIPEYKNARKNNAGVKIINGGKNSRAGKIFVDMTGGTEGSKEIFKNLAHIGVGTIVGMHLSEEHLKKAKEEFINVVIAGHISSDTLGLNLILDCVENHQAMDVINCAGFTRIKRK